MNLKIKANAINNLSDARYFAAFGVEWMGFCFDPESRDFIPPEKAKEIIDWLSGPKMVGEFGKQPPDYIQQVAIDLKLDYVQVNNKSLKPADALNWDVPFVLKCTLSDVGSLNEWSNLYKYVQLDCMNLDFSREQAAVREVCNGYPVLLEADFEPHNIKEVVSNFNISGICLKGGIEEKPGIKDFDEIEAILDQLQD